MTVIDQGVRCVQVLAFREGKRWTFAIPELTSPLRSGPGHSVAMGQSRWKHRIAKHARDVAGMWLDVPNAEVEVRVRIVDADPNDD